MTDALYWLALTAVLTLVQPLPYILERLLRIGMMNAMGYNRESGHGDSHQPSENTATWARRAYRAHINSVETFAVFAALVLIAHITNNTSELITTAAMAYFYARVAHYIVYTLGIPVLRTLAFAASLAAILTIAYVLLV